jgi:hypothetical protein
MELADKRLTRRAMTLLSMALVLLLANALVPIEQFVHRSDDAFYYFQVAAHFPETGYWTFDRINSTNGVQPLWAIVLTIIAQTLHWFVITDVETLGRIFVGVTALFHFASSMMLFYLLSRIVSLGSAIAAAGAFLFPLAIVWSRVWGMENSLYAFMLVSTISYIHLVFLKQSTFRKAGLLGFLLGLTALSRLNAALFIPCVLLYLLWRKRTQPLRERLGYAMITAGIAGGMLLLYVALNYVSTGHFLTVSGSAKLIGNQFMLDSRQIENRLSLEFVQMIATDWRDRIRWFITSRAADGLWIVGGRVLFNQNSEVPTRILVGTITAFLIAPMLFGKPKKWFEYLRVRLVRLSTFTYVLVFGILNAVISVFVYPGDIGYAIVRWWLAECEIIIVVIIATIVTTPISYFVQKFVPVPWQIRALTLVLVLLFVFHAQDMFRMYWKDEKTNYDWNLSWNIESYFAARWMEENLPLDAVVGSWNAGVVGYYAPQRVVNLDGLINNFDLLPYIEERRISDYIREREIVYLSDMGDLVLRQVGDDLELAEVYSHFSEFMQTNYYIYRVDY